MAKIQISVTIPALELMELEGITLYQKDGDIGMHDKDFEKALKNKNPNYIIAEESVELHFLDEDGDDDWDNVLNIRWGEEWIFIDCADVVFTATIDGKDGINMNIIDKR
jgi:hypothetical protein